MRGFNSLSAVGVQMIYAGSWSWQLLGFRAAGLLQTPIRAGPLAFEPSFAGTQARRSVAY
jgi:hypothetical protein